MGEMKVIIALVLALVAVSLAKDVPFSFSYCGPASPKDPDQLVAATLSPDPFKLTENVTVSGTTDIKVEVDGAWMDLDIYKRVLGAWVKIPCVDGVGSCTYDFCTILSNSTCGFPFNKYNLPCHCPFKVGTYTLPSTSVAIPPVKIPSWLSDGSYKVQARLSSFAGTELACVIVEASITK